MSALEPAQAFCPDKMPLHDALQLTSGGALAQIELYGQVYTLRITRQGKLILTK
jgi:hemin uptake protein HemP